MREPNINDDLMANLRASYQEVIARRGTIRPRSVSPILNRLSRQSGKISNIKRILSYVEDVLDIYLRIQRDRRWRDDYW